jgi:hypothetical protein
MAHRRSGVLETKAEGMSGNQQRRRGPSEKQKTILRVLAAAARPMRSADLQRRAGLLTGEFRGAIYWLRDNGYVTGVVKKVETFGLGLAKNRKAFWSILPKGRECLEPLASEASAAPVEEGKGEPISRLR